MDRASRHVYVCAAVSEGRDTLDVDSWRSGVCAVEPRGWSDGAARPWAGCAACQSVASEVAGCPWWRCPRGDDVAGDDVARYKVLEWPPWGSRRCRRLSLNRLPTMISSQSNHMIIPRPGMARSLKPIPGAGSKSTGNLAPRRALKMGGSSRVQVLVHQLGSCRAFDVLQAAIQELCVHPCALQP